MRLSKGRRRGCERTIPLLVNYQRQETLKCLKAARSGAL
jgi:hypothetical protein